MDSLKGLSRFPVVGFSDAYTFNILSDVATPGGYFTLGQFSPDVKSLDRACDCDTVRNAGGRDLRRFEPERGLLLCRRRDIEARRGAGLYLANLASGLT
jgi:hypothetical protein